MRLTKSIVPVLTCAAFSLALPAFPGAEGPGAGATGGRGKSVYHVTSLADAGEGTFRDAVSKNDRFIVFDIGGLVDLKSPIKSGSSNLTIAGETAPWDGITFRGQTVKMTGSNVILRNLKFRPGKHPANPGISTNDGFTNYLQNSIIDHVSVSWADDEALSSTDAAANSTVQYCLIAECLNYKGHGYGALIASEVPNSLLSYHHNLFANVRSRLPRLGTEKAVGPLFNFSNNIVYNWAGNAGYSANDIDSNVPLPSRTNFIANYYIAGINTKEGDAAFRGANDVTRIWIDYSLRNKLDENHDGKYNGEDREWDFFSGIFSKSEEKFAVESGYVQPADEALEQVLNCSGAFWWKPDAIDGRVIRETRAQRGSLINDPADVGGWINSPEIRRPEDYDSDRDGIPDAWEIAHGLDPKNDKDGSETSPSGYTHLERFCHEMAGFPAPKYLAYIADRGNYINPSNWELNWIPGLHDEVSINARDVTVNTHDAAARILKVDSGTMLQIKSGMLRVAEKLRIGIEADTSIEQTGGSVNVGGFLVIEKHGTYNQIAGELNASGIIVREGGRLQLKGIFSPGASGLGYCRIDNDLDLTSATLRIDVARINIGEDRLEMPAFNLTLGGKLIINPVLGQKIAPKTRLLFARVKSLKGTFSEMPQGWTLETAEKIENTYNQKYLEVYLVAPK